MKPMNSVNVLSALKVLPIDWHEVSRVIFSSLQYITFLVGQNSGSNLNTELYRCDNREAISFKYRTIIFDSRKIRNNSKYVVGHLH